MVVHACNSNTQEAEAEDHEFWGQLGLQARSCLKTKGKQARHRYRYLTPIILATQEAKIRRTAV
jgi:hypothetical protein